MQETVKEKIAAIMEQTRQRAAKEQKAAAAYRAALSKCQAIAEELLHGTDVTAKVNGDKLILDAKNGCRAEFSYDPGAIAMVGRKFCAPTVKACDDKETFFSLHIGPAPKRQEGYAQGQWGPSPVVGGAPPPRLPDSQEAFEKAILSWLEWSHIGPGAPPFALPPAEE